MLNLKKELLDNINSIVLINRFSHVTQVCLQKLRCPLLYSRFRLYARSGGLDMNSAYFEQSALHRASLIGNIPKDIDI